MSRYLPSDVSEDDVAVHDLPRGFRECADCGDLLSLFELHAWRRYNPIYRAEEDVHLCGACVPRCVHVEMAGLELRACGQVCTQATGAGEFCAKHELQVCREQLETYADDAQVLAEVRADIAKLEANAKLGANAKFEANAKLEANAKVEANAKLEANAKVGANAKLEAVAKFEAIAKVGAIAKVEAVAKLGAEVQR